mmetsp:Transcript_36766/g.113401  ORF Transcript_36766/g.113401 Transcript_36766/m.113401 type:complete len:248 (-) Transcript_36766:242-985(-)
MHRRSFSTSLIVFLSRLLSVFSLPCTLSTFSSVSSSSWFCTLSSWLMFVAWLCSTCTPAEMRSSASSIFWSFCCTCSKNMANSSSSRRFTIGCPSCDISWSSSTARFCDPAAKAAAAAASSPPAPWAWKRCLYRASVFLTCPSSVSYSAFLPSSRASFFASPVSLRILSMSRRIDCESSDFFCSDAFSPQLSSSMMFDRTRCMMTAVWYCCRSKGDILLRSTSGFCSSLFLSETPHATASFSSRFIV